MFTLFACSEYQVGHLSLDAPDPTGPSRPEGELDVALDPGWADPVPPPEDPVAVVIVVTESFATHAESCEGQPAWRREVDEMQLLLDSMGLFADVRIDAASDPITDLDGYDLVIVTNGGWGAHGSRDLYDAALDVAASGRSLLFVGDDAGWLANDYASAAGQDGWLDLLGVEHLVDNGQMGVRIGAVADHPVVDGPWGTFGEIDYAKDPDRLVTFAGTTLVTYADGTDWPVVSVVDDGFREVVANVGLYASDVCPLADASGEDSLRALFQNAVAWLVDPGSE